MRTPHGGFCFPSPDPDEALFDPPDTDVDVAALETEYLAAERLTERVLGDAEGAREAITGTAKEFSDLISADITAAGNYNEQQWRDACMVVEYAASIAQLWHDDVVAYREDRDESISSYRVQLGLLKSGTTPWGDAPYREPLVPQHGPTPLQAEVQQLLNRYNATAQQRWEEFLETAEDRARLLEEGPEPHNLKALIDAGVLGWEAHNILGPGTDVPLPLTEEEAETMAEELDGYINGDQDPDARFHEIVAALGAVQNKAGAAQTANDGRPTGNPDLYPAPEQLHPDEIAFLETLNHGLEEVVDGGVAGLMPALESGESGDSWSESERTEIAGAVAGGLLVLSDERIGGGYDKLPESVQELAEGRSRAPTHDRHDNLGLHIARRRSENWLGEAADFGDLMQHADTGLEAGRDLSANLTLSTGHHLNTVSSYNYTEEDGLGSLVGVATRNKDANHAVLTGAHTPPDTAVYSPQDEEGPPYAEQIEGLYSHEWADDGAAIAGLTDWIAEDKNNGDAREADRAGEAAYALIDTLTPETGEDDTNPFLDTRHTGEGGYAKAVTEVNSALGDSLGDVFTAYLDDFSIEGNNADDEGYRELESRSERFVFHDQGDKALRLTDDTLTDFAQLLAADEVLGARAAAAVEEQELRIIDAVLDDPALAGVGGTAAGKLRTVLDDSMINEHVSRNDDHQEALQKANETWTVGFNILMAPGSAYGGVAGESLLRIIERPLMEAYMDRAKENLGDIDYAEEEAGRLLREDAQVTAHARFMVLHAAAGRGMIDPADLPEDITVEDEETGQVRLPHNWSELQESPTDKSDDIADDLARALGENAEVLETYTDKFADKYGPDLFEERMP